LVVLPETFRGMRAWWNSANPQQSGHAPRHGPEIKDGRSSAKDGTPAGSNVRQFRSRILQMITAGAARRSVFPFYPA